MSARPPSPLPGDDPADTDGGVASGGAPLQVDPPVRVTVLAALAAAALLVAAALGDTGERLFALPVLVAAAGVVVRDLLCGPLLRADSTGLVVLSGLRPVRAAWSEVEGMRVVKDRRTPVLELDIGSTVVALSGTRLGQHPADVLEALEAHRAQSEG